MVSQCLFHGYSMVFALLSMVFSMVFNGFGAETLAKLASKWRVGMLS